MHVCGYERCGRAFAAPVRLTDLSHRPRSETYFACPYCFSKFDESEMSEVSGLLHGGGYEIGSPDGGKGSRRGEGRRSSGAEAAVSCVHGVGYLKSRSKGEAFPDGCLTCPRILQCMV